MSMHLHWVASIIILTGLGGPVSADVITDWNEKAVALVAKHRMLPPQAERVIASVHVAMFDAVNSIAPRYRPYLVMATPPKGASKEAAAAVAAGTVLAGLIPGETEALNTAMASYLATISQGAAKSDGIKIGQDVAARIVAERKVDGSDAPDAYRPKTRPGMYVPTPITASSMWPNVKPFAMTSPSQFRPAPPIALKSDEWAADYNEIKSLGGKSGSKRTPRQTEDGHFWLITGPVGYYPILRQLVAAKSMDLVDSARFMALASTAVADTFVAVFDAKYHYDFWRPITAIRNGDQDGNDATERDAGWQPLNATPMHPEYPSQNGINAGAASGVLEAIFGKEPEGFVATDINDARLSRRFASFAQMDLEQKEVRIWGGIHFRNSLDVGDEMGKKIAAHLVANYMKPVR